MNGSRRLFIAIAAGALVFGPAALGCGAGGSAKSAKIEPGDMPDGAEWTGVYFSELYGYLHLVQEGDQVNGKWERPVKDKWGKLNGKVTGNVLRFEWTEYKTGLVGPNSQATGKGYFKYSKPDNFERIDGEIGFGQDEVGQAWDAIKQERMNPDLASIGGTGASDVGGGDWDSENKEQGSPEAPAPPPEN